MRSGVERLERLDGLAEPGELYRASGHGGRGERRTSPGITVEFRQDDPGDADLLVELVGAADGVLARESVRHVQHLAGLSGVTKLGELGHQRVVDVEATRGVDEQEVMPDGSGLAQPGLENGQRIGLLGMMDFQSGPGGVGPQLLPRRRAVDVGGDEERVAPPSCQPVPELGRGGGLPRSPATPSAARPTAGAGPSRSWQRRRNSEAPPSRPEPHGARPGPGSGS